MKYMNSGQVDTVLVNGQPVNAALHCRTLKQDLEDAKGSVEPKEERPTHAFNYKGVATPINWPKGKTVANIGFVYLLQYHTNVFSVVYGLQVTKGLSHLEASNEFGQCVMHQAQCEGLVNV